MEESDESSPSVPKTCPGTVTVRRNPPRKARPTPSAIRLQNPTPSKPTDITPFPINDILSIGIPEKEPSPSTSPSPTLSPPPQNLRVYLRVRPVKPHPKSASGEQNFRLKQKNVWPQNPAARKSKVNAKKKSGEICITVNDPHSVTLSPPAAMQESKRIKSQLFEGFSHVFTTDSSQIDVFDNTMKPLVDDFMNGKSGMVAALGPSGSGKTHTVFGTNREPGMVPRALRDIFNQKKETASKFKRSFYLSIFEISSERGKLEKISDLTADGADLSLQQSTIKGLQEVAISDAAQAESLIACAMLKRATAMTNTNSQSSRSQCIINISSKVDNCDGDFQPTNAVLTIVDLAGAEREKRTGNQGSRLLESNFINNTSMVFGLCLKSLLEHQKNPTRPLQKHFQNSSLTRYLREYLEGKKRMTLVLTVKPGEDDYLDTVHLLRQASPFMRIKFNNAEELSTLARSKRHTQASRIEQSKRMKYNCLDPHVIEEEKNNEGELGLPQEACTKGNDSPRINKSDSAGAESSKLEAIDLTTRDSNSQITEKLLKSLWNVLVELKLHREKLMVAGKEIQSLNVNLEKEQVRCFKLEKELDGLKSNCTCFKQQSPEVTSVNRKFESLVYLVENESSCNNESPNITLPESDNSYKSCDSTPAHDHRIFSEKNASSHSPDLSTSECYRTCKQCDSTVGWDQDVFCQTDMVILSPILDACGCSQRQVQDIIPQIDAAVDSPNLKLSKCDGSQENVNINTPNITSSACDSFPRDVVSIFTETKVNVLSPDLTASKCSQRQENVNINSPWVAASSSDSSPRETKVDVLSPNLTASECSQRQENVSINSPSITASARDSSQKEIDVNVDSSNLKASKCNGNQTKVIVFSPDLTTSDCSQKQIDLTVDSPNLKASDCNGSQENVNINFPNLTRSVCNSSLRETEVIVLSSDLTSSECLKNSRQAQSVFDQGGGRKASGCNNSSKQVQDVSDQTKVIVLSPDLTTSDCSQKQVQDIFPVIDLTVDSPNLKASDCNGSQENVNINFPNLTASVCNSSPRETEVIVLSSDLTSSECLKNSRQAQSVFDQGGGRKASGCNNSSKQVQDVSDQELLEQEVLAFTQQRKIDAPDSETRFGTSSKREKPKRRLLPASSILLRDITKLGIEDEPEKPKGNRVGKKLGGGEKRTDGSISLLRLLRPNLHL